MNETVKDQISKIEESLWVSGELPSQQELAQSVCLLIGILYGLEAR